MSVFGVVKPVLEGQTAPGNQELVADYFEVVGHSPPGGADTLLNEVCLKNFQKRKQFSIFIY